MKVQKQQECYAEWKRSSAPEEREKQIAQKKAARKAAKTARRQSGESPAE